MYLKIFRDGQELQGLIAIKITVRDKDLKIK
jgi:hypothetical protein